MPDQYIRAGWYRLIQPDGGHLYYRDRWGEREELVSSAKLVKMGKFRLTREPLSRRWTAGCVGIFDGPGAVAAGVPTVFLDTVQKIRHKDDWRNERDDRDKAFKAGVVKELRKQNHSKQADRVGGCGVVMGRKICADCSDGTLHTSQCGQYHLCPTCARIKSQRLKIELGKHVKGVKQWRGYSWKFITLTVRTRPGQWSEALRVCVDSFSKAWRMHLKAPGAGAFRSVEFGPLNGNIHVHVLYYGPFINQAKLARAWERYTGGSYHIKIKAVREGKGKGKLIDPEHEIAFADAIEEVAKYSTKMGEVGPQKLVQFWAAIKGSHMTQRYGTLRGIPTEKMIFEKPSCEVCGCTEFFYFYNDPFYPKDERGPPRV